MNDRIRIISFNGACTSDVVDELDMCIKEDELYDTVRVVLQYRDMIARGLATVASERPELTSDDFVNALLGGAIIDGLLQAGESIPLWVRDLRLKRRMAIGFGRTPEEKAQGIDTTPPAWQLMNLRISKIDVMNW